MRVPRHHVQVQRRRPVCCSLVYIPALARVQTACTHYCTDRVLISSFFSLQKKMTLVESLGGPRGSFETAIRTPWRHFQRRPRAVRASGRGVHRISKNSGRISESFCSFSLLFIYPPLFPPRLSPPSGSLHSCRRLFLSGRSSSNWLAHGR